MREEHPAKAARPIEVIDRGTVYSVSPEGASAMNSLAITMLLPSSPAIFPVNRLREVHPAKQPASIELSPSGRAISSSEEQSVNADLPNEVTVGGRATETSLEQAIKPISGTSVTAEAK